MHLSALNITRAQLAQALGVTEATAARWLSGRSTPPEHARRLAQLVLAGELGPLSSVWAGWRLEGEYLVDPWGRRVTREEIAALPALWGFARQGPPAQADLFAPDRAALLRAALKLDPLP